MAVLRSFVQRPRFCFIICVSAALFFMLLRQEIRNRVQEERHKRDFSEIPAENIIDPTAIDLTPLVNTLINSSQSGSRQLFSLLSVTSYSSLDLHKLTLLVYNISSIKSLESSLFRRRFCYCVTNETNDLTVSQRNNSDCIYICVMAGKMGREVSGLWDVGSITPLFNQTIVEGPHTVTNISSIRLPVEWHQLPINMSHASPSGMSSILTSQVSSTAHASPHLSRTSSTTLKVTASETVTTPQYPTSSMPPGFAAESSSTVRKPETQNTWMNQGFTTLWSRTTQAKTAAAVMTSTLTATQTAARTMNRPTTAVKVLTAAPVMPQLTPRPSTATTILSAVMNLVEMRISSSETSLHTSSTRPSTIQPTEPTETTQSSRTTEPNKDRETEKPGCPWRRLEPSRNAMMVAELKLQPCVLELCKFFSQCLCRPFSQKMRTNRYCDDSFLWYEEHTFEVCRRVKRISFSKNLKQRCLSKMCNKL